MSATKPEEFFKIKRSTSEIKTEILNQYFEVWCTNILKNQKVSFANPLLFIDLFASQGYEAETKFKAPFSFSTQADETVEDLNKNVKIFLNEASKPKSDKLKVNLEKFEYFDESINQPIILDDVANQEYLEGLLHNNAPAIIYSESFGYPYAQQMFKNAVCQNNTDLFLLLNFSSIKSEILQPENDTFLIELFGAKLPEIRNNLKVDSTKKREVIITEALENLFNANGKFAFKFKINYPGKDQTSHYLMYAAGTTERYTAIKEFMQKYSDYQPDGVPTFTVNQKASQPLLPGLFTYLNKYCLENLVQEVGQGKGQFHYKTIQEIYEAHHIGTNYIRENYLTAFKNLKDVGRINLLDEKGKQVKAITEGALVFYKLHGSAKA